MPDSCAVIDMAGHEHDLKSALGILADELSLTNAPLSPVGNSTARDLANGRPDT
jgi:hypothetical protein